MLVVLARDVSEDADREPDDLNADRQLRDLLRSKMGTRTVRVLAREIGLSEGTIYNLLAQRWRAGVDTLALLVAWDGDFDDIALAALRERGRKLRETAQNVRHLWRASGSGPHP